MSYPPFHSYGDSTVSKSSNVKHPMFAAQQRPPPSLYPTASRNAPQGWSPYDQTSLPTYHSQPIPYRGFPAAATYTVPISSVNPPGPSAPRPGLAGSFDPTTGIFCRMPEHPRLRTAQACEKCRLRKAKCSGEHPSCKRCLNRGLICEYAKEGRVRGPNRAKSTSVSSSKNTNSSAAGDPERAMKASTNTTEQDRSPSHPRDKGTAREGDGTLRNLPTLPPETLQVQPTPSLNDDAVSQVLSQEIYPITVTTYLNPSRPSSSLGGRQHSQPQPPGHEVNFNIPWGGETTVKIDVSQGKWADRHTIGLDLVGAEVDPPFGRPQSMERHHAGYLLEDQRRRDLQRRHNTLPQPQGVHNPLGYHQTQMVQQMFQYPVFPVQQHSSVRVGVDVNQPHYNVHPQTAGSYGNQTETAFVLSAGGQARDFRVGPSGLEVPDLNILPSLSRRARETNEGVTNERLKEDNISVDHPLGVVQADRSVDGHGG